MGDYGQYDVPACEELLNFKVGQPAPRMLPLDRIRQAAAKKFEEDDPLFLQYGYISGYKKFRVRLAQFISEQYKKEIDPEKLFVTNGVTGALSLICSLFTSSGDTVVTEEPSYFLALTIFQDFGLNVIQCPMDEDGMNMEALEKILSENDVKMIYTVPTAHNPTGRTLSVPKREQLVELSHKYNDALIVADEVYQLLTFPHVDPPPPMFTFDKYDTILALGSFSKILAPALRIGWMQGSKKLLDVFMQCGQLDSSGGLNPVVSGIVHQAIELGLQDEYLAGLGETLWGRAQGLMNALTEHLPEGCTFEVPQGGYFVLVKLPEDCLAAEVNKLGMEQFKVQFLPSPGGPKMYNYLRLSFSYYDAEDLVTGAQRLGDCIRHYIASDLPKHSA